MGWKTVTREKPILTLRAWLRRVPWTQQKAPGKFSFYARMKSFLAAAGDIPERVATLVLTLSGRKSLGAGDIPKDADPHSLGSRSELSGQVFDSQLADNPPQPWPDGPRRPVSHAFQEVFIQGGTAVPLIINQPAVAAEVTLGLIISWPRTRIVVRSEFGPGILSERYGFQFFHP